MKASIKHEIHCISEIELIRVNARFLKRYPKCVDEGGQHFQTSHVIRYVIIFLVILLNCRQPCSGGIAFDLPAGTWSISGYHRQLPCSGRHLSLRHCRIFSSYSSKDSIRKTILFSVCHIYCSFCFLHFSCF